MQLAIALKKVKGDRVKGKEKVRASFTWSDVWRLVGNRSFFTRLREKWLWMISKGKMVNTVSRAMAPEL